MQEHNTTIDDKAFDQQETPNTTIVEDGEHAVDNEMYADDQVHLQRQLSERVVTMIAIAGTIGTGLFLSSGKAVKAGGAVGAFLGYTTVGSLVGMMMMSLGEMSVFRPNSANFVGFTRDYIEPAAGFATGYTFLIWASLMPANEIVAAGIILQYWDHNKSHLPIYCIVMIAVYILANVFAARYFGEIEFWFGMIKVVTIVGLILLGIVLDLGGGPKHERLGFRYWRDLPFNPTYLNIKPTGFASFCGFWSVLTTAAFSFGGTEALAVIAGEAKNPKRTMAKAFKSVFYRIVAMYILSILVITLNVPRNDKVLLDALKLASGTASQSPFVIMVNRAGIRALPAIINAVVFTSALSAGNQGFYSASRTITALAREGYAPKFFTRTSKRGVPYYGILIPAAVSFLSFLSVSKGSNEAFNWLSNIATLSHVLAWQAICIAYIRFRKALKVQGINRRDLDLRGWWQPYQAYIALVGFFLIMLFNGFVTFIPTFQPISFVAAYISVFLYVVLYAGYKIFFRSRLAPYNTMELLN